MKSQYHKIREIATEVRATEVRAHNSFHLKSCCAISSYRLWNRLLQEGFDPIFVVHHGKQHTQSPLNPKQNGWGSHCFLLCNGYIVDITATQFNIKQKVLIRRHKNGQYWFVTKTATSKEKIRDLLRCWPAEQKPPELYKKYLTSVAA